MTLRRYGLFDAKVPRYTSYPPANRFESDVGHRKQKHWLHDLSADEPVSIYVHIPFCRRLCWFCACRTQGTKTLEPLESYLLHTIKEIEALANIVPAGLQMARLHLGGGTPTLLSPDQMNRLFAALWRSFTPSSEFEFSVEVDPTEAEPEAIDMLGQWSLKRASIGVQDFDFRVQSAIGRQQSLEQTETVVTNLRNVGVQSLNVDLLYGLPFQTESSLTKTLDQVVSLKPDRIALYGYAHVPHVSKRQIMIPVDALPNGEVRFRAFKIAADRLKQFDYLPLGIDHFARPHDSLAQAASMGKMRRNFQGYTDDPCKTLIGIGASAISMFQNGFVQNAVATAAYKQRISSGGLAGHKGYLLTHKDRVISKVIEQIMCDGQIDFPGLGKTFGTNEQALVAARDSILKAFPDCFDVTSERVTLKPGLRHISRLVAAKLDAELRQDHIHSSAI